MRLPKLYSRLISALTYPCQVSSTGQALHRSGFVLKRPRKRLVKADPARREAFVAEYVALAASARRTGAKVFFADEAHFQADADLRGKWAQKGEPALVSSSSPRRGEKGGGLSPCWETTDRTAKPRGFTSFQELSPCPIWWWISSSWRPCQETKRALWSGERPSIVPWPKHS